MGPQHADLPPTALPSPRASQGERFDNYGDVQCRFGPVAVPGVFHHRGAITCVAPPAAALCRWHGIPVGTHARPGNYGRVAKRYGAPSSAAGGGAGWDPFNASADDCGGAALELPSLHTVEVSFNGVDFTGDSQATFVWYDAGAVKLSRILPTAGPVDGGTMVTISGAMVNDYGGRVKGCKCQFGSAFGSPVVNATAHPPDKLLCATPPLPVALRSGMPVRQDVYISLSGYADARTLLGLNLSANTSSGSVEARQHGVSGDGSMGEDSSGPLAVLSFRYDAAPPNLTRVEPLGGPTAGGSAVTLSAAHAMMDDGEPLCLFGSASSPLPVPASVDEQGRLRCTSPPLDAVSFRGARPPGAWCAGFNGETRPCKDGAYAADGVLAVALDVTLNGNHSDASGRPVTWLFFGVEPLEQLQFARPLGGPAAGGTQVEVVGHGLLDFGGVLCVFAAPGLRVATPSRATLVGGVSSPAGSGPAALAIHAVMHDGRATRAVRTHAARMVRCTSPPLAPRYSATNYTLAEQQRLHTLDKSMPLPEPEYEPLTRATLAISLDGGQSFARGVNFFYADPKLSSLEPAGGPHRGGTPVTVHGRGFMALGDDAPHSVDSTRGGGAGMGIGMSELGHGQRATHGSQGGGSGGVRCGFEGAGVTAGTVLTTTQLVCLSPPLTNFSGYDAARGSASLPDTRVRVLLNGESSAAATDAATTAEAQAAAPYSSAFAIFRYTPPELVVSSITPSVGPASGGTLVTILGSQLANLGTPTCRFGPALPTTRAELLVRAGPGALDLVIGGSNGSAPAAGEYVEGLLCRTPPHLALRATALSQACAATNSEWHHHHQCGSVESVLVDISLNGRLRRQEWDGAWPAPRDGTAPLGEVVPGQASAQVSFTFVAFIANPVDGGTALPPPPPIPSPPPSQPAPSPPPPQPIDCHRCDAGAGCGICLVLLTSSECPPIPEAGLARCDQAISMYSLCEGDGECGTNVNANNCGPGGFDVYQRVRCYPMDDAG